ncbi:TMEM165/GDT1 family protein [Candidatus Micrarchaeota archaeon]|nr:TMEM165/GDT1 family protein [Candidatus Micrarchaeota archaeon]
MLDHFLSTFFAIGLAELGDKTQFAVLALSAKCHKKAPVILAAIIAFALANAIAVVLGSIFSFALPTNVIKIAAGALFILVGLHTLFLNKQEKEEEVKSDRNVFISAFTMLFLMEMGDKTQFANMLFATIYNPLLVMLAATLAMSLLAILAVVVGKKLFKHLNARTIKTISGLLFIIVGAAVLFFG